MLGRAAGAVAVQESIAAIALSRYGIIKFRLTIAIAPAKFSKR
jgi:hypothetical protein